ncbi:MAG TPA: hypothetical protein VHO70_21695 [Chitinispirillaceae bacterium]|nr:hypothetical protein [Chitinispirillaceae bacterium]
MRLKTAVIGLMHCALEIFFAGIRTPISTGDQHRIPGFAGSTTWTEGLADNLINCLFSPTTGCGLILASTRIAPYVTLSSERTLDVNLEMAAYPWTSYLQNTIQFELDETKQAFSFNFRNNTTDVNGRINFNVAGSPPVMTIDNISIIVFDPAVTSFSPKKIKNAELQTRSGETYSHSFDFVKLYNGFYIVKIENEGNSVQRPKIIVQRYITRRV